MKKRGQITIFVILGIVIVALIVLAISLRREILVPVHRTDIDSSLMRLRNHVEDCIRSSGENYIERIALQGGYLSPGEGSYRFWNDTPVSYLCYNQMYSNICTNRLLTLNTMETQLADAIKQDLITCIDLSSFETDFDVKTTGEMRTNVDILQSRVLLQLEYTITLESEDDTRTAKIYNVAIDRPLGELYDVAMDIIDAHTSIGSFDTLTYMLSKIGRYTIYLSKPYPDELYVIKLREHPFRFQMAVQGEAR